jgi:hypothetical protein
MRVTIVAEMQEFHHIPVKEGYTHQEAQDQIIVIKFGTRKA